MAHPFSPRMIELRALGTLALQDPNHEALESVLAQPKRVALLVYLTVARPCGFHRRDTLLALLWPEQDEQHARWALNQALRHLRTALGKEVVPSRGDGEIGIDAGALRCDAVAFEAALEADDLARALELYRGDLLEGFHVSGCGEFERWLEEERVWLRRRAARAAATLARREEARGEVVAAGHWARRALALAPDDESEARNLIELLGRLGDRAGAVQAYEEFAHRLRVEYEVDPAPETQAAIKAVRERLVEAGSPPAPAIRQVSSGPRPATPEKAVVGREWVVARRGRKLLFVALGLLTVVGVGSLISGPRSPPNASGRSNTLLRTTVAVLPFVYRGSPELAYLGEGIVDLLSANLNGAGEIRTVTPHAVLAQARQAAGERLSPEQARSIAARVGAGSFVVGSVVETGGRLRISARLHSGARGESGGQVLVDGPSGDLFRLVDGLTAQLIAQQSGGPAATLSRLAALTTDSLPALKAYLEGERQYRAGRLDSSIAALDRAIRIDSTFALAHYRMATVSMWTSQRHRSSGAVERALRHAHRLSYHDRRLIDAVAASLQGRNAEAERIYGEVVTRYPDDIEAAYQLGDLIFHRRSAVGRSWLDARELFERVLSIDPGYIGALEHLSSIAARERRLGELDSLTERVLEIGVPLAWFNRGQRAVAVGDSAELSRFMAALREASEDIAQPTGGFVVAITGDLSVGRDIWRLMAEPSRSRGVRVLAHLTLAKIEIMTGRWRAAMAELDAAQALDSATALEHRALLSLWPLLNVAPSELRKLQSRLLQWKAAPGPADETSVSAVHAPAHPYLRVYLLGLLSARLGEDARALSYASDLERRAQASFAPSLVDDLGRAVRAEVARGHGRAAEALKILDSTWIWKGVDLERTGNSPFADHEYEQFMRAELLYALGRYSEALLAYRTLAHDLFHSGAPAHRRMAEIYYRQGDREKAAAHYARFAELWKDCDPEFRSLVEDARRRMVM